MTVASQIVFEARGRTGHEHRVNQFRTAPTNLFRNKRLVISVGSFFQQ